MQRKLSTMTRASIRNKLMVACALVAACVLAAPAAMAHDSYRGRGDRSADILGALVVGAVIGGVLVSASQHHHDYYDSGYYYPAQAYPQPGYYGGYPAYSYNDGGYYSYPSYPGYGSVNVGVVYTSGHDYRWRGRDNRHDRGARGYYGNRGGYYDGGQGRYYSRHGH